MCLLLDALLQIILQLRSADPSSGNEKCSLLFDLLAGTFYTLAGSFAGYASATTLLQFGNCCWLVGSLASCVRPTLALCERTRRGGAVTLAAEGAAGDGPQKSKESDAV